MCHEPSNSRATGVAAEMVVESIREDMKGEQPTDREKALWALLDNIDTASDMFKPTDLTGYRTFYDYVMKQAAFRHNHLKSDGYNLYLPGMKPEDTSKPQTPMTSNAS